MHLALSMAGTSSSRRPLPRSHVQTKAALRSPGESQAPSGDAAVGTASLDVLSGPEPDEGESGCIRATPHCSPAVPPAECVILGR